MMVRFFMSMCVASVMVCAFGCSKPQNAEVPKGAPTAQEEEKKEAAQTEEKTGEDRFKMDPRAAEFFKKAEDF